MVIYLDKALSNFLNAVRRAFGQGLSEEVSEPYDPSGLWFIDLVLESYKLLVQYSAKHGFGLSANPTEFGDAPDELYGSESDAIERALALLSTQGHTIPATTLSGLRGTQTQSQVANLMDIKQPSYAKMEGGQLATLKVETLVRVVGAMHAKLHLVVESGDGKFFVLKDKSDVYSTLAGCTEFHASPPCANPPRGLVALDTSRFAIKGVDSGVARDVVVGLFKESSKLQRRRSTESGERLCD